MKRLQGFLCITLLLCLMLSSCEINNSLDGQDDSPVKRSRAVEITIRDLEGRSVNMSQFTGRVVVLNFWATWCPACVEEMPSMNEFYKKFKGSGLIMLAVSIEDDAQRVADFIKKNNYTLPVYHDPGRKAASAYGVSGIPAAFFIDKKGVVAKRVIGPLNWMKPKVVSFVQDLLQ